VGNNIRGKHLPQTQQVLACGQKRQFLKALKEKKWMGLDNTRPLMPPMSMMPATQMSDDEMKKLFLLTLKQHHRLRMFNNCYVASSSC